MQFLTRRLAVGDSLDLIEYTDRGPVRANGVDGAVDAVLCCARECACGRFWAGRLPFLQIPLVEGERVPEKDLATALSWLAKQIRAGRRTLVHCASGVSRSVAVLAAFLHVSGGIPLWEALDRVRRVRPIANPDPFVWESVCAYFSATP